MTDIFDFESLFHSLHEIARLRPWVQQLRSACEQALLPTGHGDLEKWIGCVKEFPTGEAGSVEIEDGRVVVDGNYGRKHWSQDETRDRLMAFHPWRKGPFRLLDQDINTEWRSDWKWQRLEPHVEFRDRRVLDVGCGNGYFGWQMLNAGARQVVGLDPFLLFVIQNELVRRLNGYKHPNYVLPLKDDCLPNDLRAFDVTLSMGVLYHRTSPIDHLLTLRNSLAQNGLLVLETLILESESNELLVPEDRYAKMRNVWFIPSLSLLNRWLQRVGFIDIKVIDVTRTSTQEQRRTEWMTFESLADFLDPQNIRRTIEGHPAPVRAMLTARSKR